MNTSDIMKDYKKIQEAINNKRKMDNKHTIELALPDKYILNTLTTYLQDIREYDDNLYNHSISVSAWSGYIGKVLQLDKDEIDNLYMAGALHDIGKLFIPEEIVKKPSQLDRTERRIIESHSSFSVFYLKSSNVSTSHSFTPKILNMIECHHEELCGGGYPNRLSGNEIGTGARIVSVADKFDAYGSKRVYHSERSLDDTFAFLHYQVEANILDKEIVDDFVRSIVI